MSFETRIACLHLKGPVLKFFHAVGSETLMSWKRPEWRRISKASRPLSTWGPSQPWSSHWMGSTFLQVWLERLVFLNGTLGSGSMLRVYEVTSASLLLKHCVFPSGIIHGIQGSCTEKILSWFLGLGFSSLGATSRSLQWIGTLRWPQCNACFGGISCWDRGSVSPFYVRAQLDELMEFSRDRTEVSDFLQR